MHSSIEADATLDLSEVGCGQLVMEIMFAMRALQPGQILRVTAYDPAAPLDIQAWCGMTGNILFARQPDATGHLFFLQKGRDSTC